MDAEWLRRENVAILISVVSLCGTAFSLWMQWRRDRRADEAALPQIEAMVSRAVADARPNAHLYMLDVRVTNRRDHPIQWRDIRVDGPATAAFVDQRITNMIEFDFDKRTLETIDEQLPAASIGKGHHLARSLYFEAPPGSRVTFSLEMVLLSHVEEVRRFVIHRTAID